MGRKEQAEARQQSDALYNFGIASAKGSYDVAAKGAKELSTSEGYSPQEKGAIQQESLGVASSAYGKARDAARLRVARTRNSAGYGAFNEEIARDEAKTDASIANTNLINFANEKERRRETGLGVSSDLYGKSIGATESGLGYKTNLANQQGFGAKTQEAALKAIFG